MHAGERRFAVLLTLPGLLVLLLTTTIPLIYLIWSSFQTINLSMPFLDGFAGVDNSLFFKENTRMLFGDAKATVGSLVSEFKQ